MSRKKVDIKKVIVSVSLSPMQKRFIDSHPHFNFSQFCQLILDEYIEMTKELERRISWQKEDN